MLLGRRRGGTGASCLKGIMPKFVVSCINLLSPICCRRCAALLGNLALIHKQGIMPKGKRSGVKQRVLKKSGSVKKEKLLKGSRNKKRTPKMQRRDVEWRSRLSVKMTWSANKFRSHLPLSLRDSYRKVVMKADLMRVFLLKCQLQRGIGLYTWKAFESF